MKCFKCGYEMPDDALFCPHCGQNHDNTPHFCSKCGNPVDKTMKFCENCGAPIQNATKKEEKKVECPELPVDDLVDVGLDVIERLQGDPNSHAQEIHNAKPTQRDTFTPAGTPVASETPAAAGGAGQKIRRDSVSVREAAAQAQAASAEALPTQEQPAAPMQTSAAQPQATAPTQQAPQAQTSVSAEPSAQPVASQAQASAVPQAAAPVQTAAPAQAQTVAPQQTAAAPAPVQSAPVQAPVQPQAPVQAPVSQAAPVMPHIPAAPVSSAASAAASVASGVAHAAGSAASSVAAEVAHTAGAVAVAGVKKAGSTAKTIAILAAVVAFVIGAAAACLNFFVPAPEDTVDKLISSVEELKYDDMLSCFDSTTEKQIRAVMGITGDLMGSLTGISIDLEDMMALAPSLAPYMEIPDLGIADAETVLYADCSKAKLLQYCETANSGGSIPTGYLSDNEIISFLDEYNLTLPGLENLIAEVAVVKITLKSGEVGYLPLINEGWGDWRIPMMDLAGDIY